MTSLLVIFILYGVVGSIFIIEKIVRIIRDIFVFSAYVIYLEISWRIFGIWTCRTSFHKYRVYLCYENLAPIDKCAICQETFNRDIPQSILLCGHRYCAQCLNTYEHYQYEPRFEYPKPDNFAGFKCPLCREWYSPSYDKVEFDYDMNRGFWSAAPITFHYTILLEYL